MITGESGTGKEMVARAIHYESRRADQPFITENCGALPDTLLESELFGYKRGAFTGAVEDRVGLIQQADGGTLFLDEIGETSPAFQVKLLRVLQEGEFRPLGSNRAVTVDVRVIAATNRNLDEDLRSGRFREDLYYRLATIALHVPPLRERPMDIPLLADRLLDTSCQCPRQDRDRLHHRRAGGCSPPITGRATCANCRTKSCAWWPGDGPKLGAELLSPRVLRTPVGDRRVDSAGLGGELDGGLKERLEQLEMQVLKGP